MLAMSRVNFASAISHETMKNPEAMNAFICSVAETVSLPDLSLIQAMFYQTLEITKKQSEENHKN